MKVTELKAECEARGLDASGKKADLVARLESDDADDCQIVDVNDTSPAAAADAAPSLTPDKMKVSELKAELEKLGEDTSGRKPELVARLEAALRRGSPDLDAPPAKKQKPSPAWFWAGDNSDKTGREWFAYPPDTTAEVEAAYDRGEAEHKISGTHAVVFTPHATTGLFLQKRIDNNKLTQTLRTLGG